MVGASVEAFANKWARVARIWLMAPKTPIMTNTKIAIFVCGQCQFWKANGAIATVATPLDHNWLVALLSCPANCRVKIK